MTPSAIKRWTLGLIGDTLIFGAAYLGIIEGVEWALNVFLFVAWAYAIVLSIAGFIKEQLVRDGVVKPRTSTFKVWDVTTNVALCLVAAASGLFVLATFLLIATASKEAVQEVVEKVATHSADGVQ